MSAATISIRNYVTITAAYWAFTLTDGALRMLVLLHFNQLGYTPVQLAFLFLLYEFFGIVTNLVGGWLAARTGLRFTLVLGLAFVSCAKASDNIQPLREASVPNKARAAGFASSSLPVTGSTINTASAATWNNER